MGKYAPVLKAAECGSMTRAAQTMGYTQPSLGYIINNIENELGVKIFYRDQRGVTPTEVGVGLLDIMRQIEAMENRLQETARVSKQELLRVVCREPESTPGTGAEGVFWFDPVTHAPVLAELLQDGYTVIRCEFTEFTKE